MANHTPLPHLERAEARLNFRIQEEQFQRKKRETIERAHAKTRAYFAELRLACQYAVRQCQDIAATTVVAETLLALRKEATERATRQAAQELAQPLGNNRRSRPY